MTSPLRPLLLTFVILNSSAVTLRAAPPPELTVLRQQYDKVITERVTAPFDASLAELNTKFATALANAITAAKQAGKLDDVLAITTKPSPRVTVWSATAAWSCSTRASTWRDRRVSRWSSVPRNPAASARLAASARCAAWRSSTRSSPGATSTRIWHCSTIFAVLFDWARSVHWAVSCRTRC